MITWQSKPDFDEWGFDTYWNATQWMEWLSALSAHYGQANGALEFYNAWMSRSGWFEALGDVRADMVSLNGHFRDYVAQYTLPGGTNLLAALEDTVELSGVMGAGTDVVNDAGEILDNVTDTLKNTTNTLTWLVPVAIIAALILVGYIFYKNDLFINLKTK